MGEDRRGGGGEARPCVCVCVQFLTAEMLGKFKQPLRMSYDTLTSGVGRRIIQERRRADRGDGRSVWGEGGSVRIEGVGEDKREGRNRDGRIEGVKGKGTEEKQGALGVGEGVLGVKELKERE